MFHLFHYCSFFKEVVQVHSVFLQLAMKDTFQFRWWPLLPSHSTYAPLYEHIPPLKLRPYGSIEMCHKSHKNGITWGIVLSSSGRDRATATDKMHGRFCWNFDMWFLRCASGQTDTQTNDDCNSSASTRSEVITVHYCRDMGKLQLRIPWAFSQLQLYYVWARHPHTHRHTDHFLNTKMTQWQMLMYITQKKAVYAHNSGKTLIFTHYRK